MREVTIPEFHALLKAQGVSSREHLAFVCPMCATVQSGADLMAATGKPFDEVEKYLGFSCLGRFIPATQSQSALDKKRKLGTGCDWTLGGLLQLHTLVVIDEEGKRHPRFEPATPEQAQAHEKSRVPA